MDGRRLKEICCIYRYDHTDLCKFRFIPFFHGVAIPICAAFYVRPLRMQMHSEPFCTVESMVMGKL